MLLKGELWKIILLKTLGFNSPIPICSLRQRLLYRKGRTEHVVRKEWALPQSPADIAQSTERREEGVGNGGLNAVAVELDPKGHDAINYCSGYDLL